MGFAAALSCFARCRFWAVVLGVMAPVQAAFLDLTIVNPGLGNGGTFAGSLDGVPVAGSATASGIYQINPAAEIFAYSTVDGISPQYSFANVYDPPAPGADRIGYSASDGSNARITITFGAPVSDLRFHVADLDRSAYTFALTDGLTGISLVRGNGGDGDGLQVIGNVVSDANPATSSSLFTSTPPTTIGPRSAFGTISLIGMFTTLSIDVVTAGGSDGGSFTLSSVPEPTTMAVLGVLGLGLLRRKRTNCRL